MGITDKLRKYAQSWRETPNLMDDLDAGDIDGLLDDIETIADRIDAEHEKTMGRAGQLLADAEKDRDYNYANWQDCKQKVLQGNITFDELNARIECLEDELSHCIELPMDADGEVWNVGDFAVGEINPRNPKAIERMIWYGPDSGWQLETDTIIYPCPDRPRHYHEPTVKDVLREMTVYWDCAADGEDKEAVLKEYAAKLRLAGDEGEQ